MEPAPRRRKGFRREREVENEQCLQDCGRQGVFTRQGYQSSSSCIACSPFTQVRVSNREQDIAMLVRTLHLLAMLIVAFGL